MGDLRAIYRSYISCLNRQDWARLGEFVGDAAHHNDRPLGLAGYRAMLEQAYRAIPDLRFDVALLIMDEPHVAARLDFTCTPVGEFLGLAVNGRTISFSENVFYRFADDKINHVWSVIDKPAIEASFSLRDGRSC